MERVKKEYEEKQRKKKEEKEKKEKEKDDKKNKKDKDKKDEDDKKDKPEVRLPSSPGHQEDAPSDSLQEKEAEKPTTAAAEVEEEEPRLFELKRLTPPLQMPTLTLTSRSAFYQQRLGRKRQIEMAKRNRERLQDPTFFPSVPKNLP